MPAKLPTEATVPPEKCSSAMQFLILTLLFLVALADDTQTYDACDPQQPGGARCTCGVSTTAAPLIVYNCRLQRLTTVPETYGNDTSEINLSNNKIIQVERGKFTNLREMELLYLQANYIRYIEAGAFNGLMRLKEIFLQSNRLENVSQGIFDHLPALEIVNLQNNYITTINRYSFFFTPSLNIINMDNNPLTCGCEEKFFREFLDVRTGLLTLNKARCNNLANGDLATLDTSLFPTCTDTIIICESYMANISCSEPQATIDITFARYGRTSTALCRNTTRPHSRTDCTGVVTSAVRNKCNGRNACELHASNSVYGDPCQNTYKYMEVTYECKPGESLFRKDSSCYTCADVNSPKACAHNNTGQACSGARDVCFNRVQYQGGHLGVWGGCTDYTSCMTQEAGNADKCRQGAITQCHYCSRGRNSNRFDVMNTVKSFDVLATVTLDRTLTSDLLDTTSTERKNFETNFVNVVNGIIYGQKGSYSVAVDEIRAPFVTIVLTVNCNTIWYISKPRVLRAINDSVTANGYYLYGSPLISLHLILKEDALSVCLPESVPSVTFGTFNWPQTRAGIVSLINCPNQQPGGKVITASRSCMRTSNATARWGTANIDECYPVSSLPAELQKLANIQITNDNVIDVSSNVSALSENWNEYTEHELSWTTDIIEGILGTDAITTSRDAIQNTLQTMNNVLYIESLTLEVGESEYDTSTRLVKSVDQLLAKIDVTTKDFGEVRGNMAGFVFKSDSGSFSGISLSTDVKNENLLTSGKVDVDTSGGAVSGDKSGIQIPSSAFNTLSTRNREKIAKGTLNLYREPKIFDTISSKPQPKEITLKTNKTVTATRQINSHVIGASFPGVNIKDITEPVKVTFQHFKEAVNPECVYWETTSSGGQWANGGCMINTTDDSYTVCDCDHLTNFALLMDVYGSGGSLSEADRMALAIISYIGCGVSFIAMCLTLITFLMFKKLRKENPGKILMNLCVAIGLADLVFVAGMQGYTSNSDTGCKVVAALLHFFLMAVICWMAVEAFYMYLALVKVFDTYIARFQLKSSLFGWGVPLVIVILTLSINKTDNYGLQPGGICWLSRIPFYTAFLAPVVLIIVINSIVFVFVMKQIVNRSSNKLTKTEKSSATVRLRGAISVIVLLGLTWIFAIFAVGDFGLVFHYLFAIVNSLQGLFIFFFYCCLKSDVRNLWKRKCACIKSPYESTDTGTRSRDRGFSSATDQTMKTNVSDSRRTSDTRRQSDVNGKVSPQPSPLLTKPQTAFRGRWQLQNSAPKKTIDNPDMLSFTDV